MNALTKSFFVFFITTWMIIFLGCLFCYKDSKIWYVLFSLFFLVLILSAFVKAKSYSYLFLSVFLWLGFWVKFSIHTYFNNPYQESIGSFSLLNDSLDPILMISVIGCLGMLSARALLGFLKIKSTIKIDAPLQHNYLEYKNRKVFDYLIIISVPLLALLNLKYKIFQIGLVPQTVLAWPLNAIDAWLLNVGFILMIAYFMFFETQNKKRITLMFLYVLFEATFSSISILSRGLYILHVIPVVVFLMFNQDRIKLPSLKMIIMFIGLSGILLLVSIKMVSIARNNIFNIYGTYTTDGSSSGNDFLGNFIEDKEVSKRFGYHDELLRTISQLAIDRWLGIEGVMAVLSYPNKSITLFKEGVLERPGKSGLYQKIAQSPYRDSDRKQYSFATLPGAIAFLYYSGSLLFVFFGMFAFTFIIMLSERFVLFLTNNSLVCSVYGIAVAYTIEQFCPSPINVLKHYILVFIFFMIIYLIRMSPFSRESQQVSLPV